MALPKYATGLSLMLASLVLTRVAVYFAYSAPGSTPEQIWYGLSPAFKSIVLGGALLFGAGIWTLIRDLVRRILN